MRLKNRVPAGIPCRIRLVPKWDIIGQWLENLEGSGLSVLAAPRLVPISDAGAFPEPRAGESCWWKKATGWGFAARRLDGKKNALAICRQRK
jgi:hypothetical protein